MPEQIFRFRIGDFELVTIKDGGGPRDVSNMYVGITPYTTLAIGWPSYATEERRWGLVSKRWLAER